VDRRPVVAVVDDDSRLLESLEELLESAGYAVRCFGSARELLSGDLTAFDLLITDVGMPDMDGFRLREEMRRARPDLPVFMITGRHEIADQVRAQGTHEFFRKPLDGPVLLSAIEDALRTQA
jgi:FixJ family two-component response regulator